MKITFLGTAAGKPSKYRNVTSIAIELDSSEFILVDCGEGTQTQIIKSNLKINKLNSIYITHLHGDHIFGLPGLLASLNEYRTDDLNIYGPVGISNFISFMVNNNFSRNNNYSLNVLEIDDTYGRIESINYKNTSYDIEYCHVIHDVPCYSYTITKIDTSSKINIKKLQPFLDKYSKEIINLGYNPVNRIISKLKEDKEIKLSDIILNLNTFEEDKMDNKRLTICLDNSCSNNLLKFIKKTNCLVHECTYAFTEETKNDDVKLTSKAISHGHSTSRMGSLMAKKLNCDNLIFTHFSNRYEISNGKMIDEDFIINDCEKISNCDVKCAYDFSEFDI